jgi:hypothetical protein
VKKFDGNNPLYPRFTLWDAAQKELVMEITANDTGIACAVFGSGGRTVEYLCQDGDVRSIHLDLTHHWQTVHAQKVSLGRQPLGLRQDRAMRQER